MTIIFEIRSSSFRWNDNVFLPETLRRKGLNWPITQRY